MSKNVLKSKIVCTDIVKLTCSNVKLAELARILGQPNPKCGHFGYISNFRHHLSIILIVFLLLPLNLFALGGKKYDPTTLVYPSFLHTMGIRKATKLHLMIYTGNKVKVKNPQGLAVVRLNSWEDPKNKNDDDEVTGYGVNSGTNVIVYNKSMSSLGFYGLKEVGERKLNNPTAVAANELGDVYVADTGNHRIVRFFNPKSNLNFIRAIGGKGSLPGRFLSPRGLVMDSNHMVYVADTGNHRIQIIRPDDQLHLWFGNQGFKDGQLWHPTGLAVTTGKGRWSYYKDRFIALIDLDGMRIQKFDLEGRFMKAIHLQDLGFENGELLYMAIDYYCNIWVTDFANHCIHKFDRNLNYLTSFGRKGGGKKEFFEPRGIAIYKRFGQVFIVEKEAAQYYWVGTDILDLNSNWLSDKRVVELSFVLTEPTFITMTVEGEGVKKKTLFEKKKYFTGPRKIYLDGNWNIVASSKLKDQGHNQNSLDPKVATSAPGKYKLIIKVESTYSSYKYFSKEVETTVLIN